MWELDYKESWALKNCCFWTVCWWRLLRVPWTARRSSQSILKEISPEYSAEAETPILWPPDVKNWLIGKDPDAGRDWRQEEKGVTEDEMVGWHPDSMDMSLSKLQELVIGKTDVLQCMGSQRVGYGWATQPNWTEGKERHSTGCFVGVRILFYEGNSGSRRNQQNRKAS